MYNQEGKKMNSIEVAKIIKEERIKKGWTKYRLAKLTGLTGSQIQSIEEGSNLRINTLSDVLRVLGKKIDIVDI